MPNDDKYLASKLKKKGAKIGNNFKVFGASSVYIDDTRGWLLTIGDNVHITHNVMILTHDNSRCVIKNMIGYRIDEGAETKIGNNCFIGMNSILLMGTQLGNNVIVGAGSVVHGIFPDNVVICGNPARIICTIESHIEKRQLRTRSEAINVAKLYIERYKKKPSENEMNDFISLFTHSKILEWKNFEDFLEEVNIS